MKTGSLPTYKVARIMERRKSKLLICIFYSMHLALDWSFRAVADFPSCLCPGQVALSLVPFSVLPQHAVRTRQSSPPNPSPCSLKCGLWGHWHHISKNGLKTKQTETRTRCQGAWTEMFTAVLFIVLESGNHLPVLLGMG